VAVFAVCREFRTGPLHGWPLAGWLGWAGPLAGWMAGWLGLAGLGWSGLGWAGLVCRQGRMWLNAACRSEGAGRKAKLHQNCIHKLPIYRPTAAAMLKGAHVGQQWLFGLRKQ